MCVGAISGAHGVAGAVRIKSFTVDPLDVAAYGPVTDEPGERSFELAISGMSAGAVLARIEGVEDRDAAEALKGTRLYVPRGVLPPPEEDEFYHADLLGLRAVRPDGSDFGVVTAVHEVAGGEALEIEPGDGAQPVLVPFTREEVPEVDLSGGRVVVEPRPEVIDGEDGHEGEA